jgi:hypothetical protein
MIGCQIFHQLRRGLGLNHSNIENKDYITQTKINTFLANAKAYQVDNVKENLCLETTRVDGSQTLP